MSCWEFIRTSWPDLCWHSHFPCSHPPTPLGLAVNMKFAMAIRTVSHFRVKEAWILTWARWFFGAVVCRLLASLMPQWYRICLPSSRQSFYAWVRKIPWRRKWQPVPEFLPGKSHWQRNLAHYRPWGHKESNMT